MVSLDNAEIMVNQAFAHEPDAIVNVFEDENLIAILYKEDWESDKFNHVKAKCRQYKAPAFFEMGEIPFVGKVINIRLSEVAK